MINPSPKPMAARPAESVQVFSSGPPTQPHIDVALLEAEQQSDLSNDNTPQFINKLRARAAVMGCDGIVLGNVTSSTDPSFTREQNGSKKGITATCIMFQDAPPPPPPSAS